MDLFRVDKTLIKAKTYNETISFHSFSVLFQYSVLFTNALKLYIFTTRFHDIHFNNIL